MNKYYLLLLFLFGAQFCSAQSDSMTTYIAHATIGPNGPLKILHDSTSRITFMVDTARVNITAVDAHKRILWRTDPWKDNMLDRYRVDRPIIVRFYFVNEKRTHNQNKILIVYNNTQCGFVDLKTGKFTFLGQD